MMIPSSAELLLESRIIVCVGPGGVGKTTVSALLGLMAARLGKKAICVTVDPSERLAESLGLGSFLAAGSREDEGSFMNVGVEEKIRKAAEGLDAVMIHGPWIIDRAIKRYVPQEKLDVIRRGKIYPYMKHTLKGLHELAGMVLVDDLVRMGRWDVVIVDTAPSAHAVDFLEMPGRIVRAVRSPFIGILAGYPTLNFPGGRFIERVSSMVLKSAGKLIGLNFLAEISEFLKINRESLENIYAAGEAIRSNLEEGWACIVQVTSPEAQSIDETLFLHRMIVRQGLATKAIVVNRVLPFDSEVMKCAPALEAAGELLREKIAANMEEMKRASGIQEREIRRLMRDAPQVAAWLRIPLMEEDVHGVGILTRLIEMIEEIN